MPFIACDIRRGRSDEQCAELCARITDAVHRFTDAPVEAILVVVREHAANRFMEGGWIPPEYEAGPDGQDMAGMKAVASRFAGD